MRGKREKWREDGGGKNTAELSGSALFVVAAFLDVLMGVMVALLLHRKTLKRSEGATRQKGFSMGLSLDSLA